MFGWLFNSSDSSASSASSVSSSHDSKSTEFSLKIKHAHVPSLCELPFEYKPKECGILISSHPAFHYLSLVTNLDYELIKYLNNKTDADLRVWDHTIDKYIPFSDIFSRMRYISDVRQIMNYHHLFDTSSSNLSPDSLSTSPILYATYVCHTALLDDLLANIYVGNKNAFDLSTFLERTTVHFDCLYPEDACVEIVTHPK